MTNQLAPAMATTSVYTGFTAYVAYNFLTREKFRMLDQAIGTLREWMGEMDTRVTHDFYQRFIDSPAFQYTSENAAFLTPEHSAFPVNLPEERKSVELELRDVKKHAMMYVSFPIVAPTADEAHQMSVAIKDLMLYLFQQELVCIKTRTIDTNQSFDLAAESVLISAVR